mmetsp:Transcript_9873/g.19567  ORF Transcript_9873/g.19567 Transcript_9873/m.19567 type:complete len:305 (+) Transcript_9873:487-1401(+)
MHSFGHYPVFWRNVKQLVQQQALTREFLFADGTLGGGGHSAVILESFPNAYVVGTDVDSEAVKRAAKNLEPFSSRTSLAHSSYTDLHKLPRFPEVFGPNKQFDFVLLDLGMSSYQLDAHDRGFSFTNEGPLDMRFDQSDATSADCYKLVNFASEYELREIFKRFGEEKLYRELANNIAVYRKEKKITSTTQLAEIFQFTFLKAKVPNRFRSVTRSFQALRIAVNKELDNIARFCDSILPHVAPSGVLMFISFHSLEDNIVNSKLVDWHWSGRANYPTREPVTPSDEEMAENSRSHSAIFRYAIK